MRTMRWTSPCRCGPPSARRHRPCRSSRRWPRAGCPSRPRAGARVPQPFHSGDAGSDPAGDGAGGGHRRRDDNLEDGLQVGDRLAAHPDGRLARREQLRPERLAPFADQRGAVVFRPAAYPLHRPGRRRGGRTHQGEGGRRLGERAPLPRAAGCAGPAMRGNAGRRSPGRHALRRPGHRLVRQAALPRWVAMLINVWKYSLCTGAAPAGAEAAKKPHGRMPVWPISQY